MRFGVRLLQSLLRERLFDLMDVAHPSAFFDARLNGFEDLGYVDPHGAIDDNELIAMNAERSR